MASETNDRLFWEQMEGDLEEWNRLASEFTGEEHDVDERG